MGRGMVFILDCLKMESGGNKKAKLQGLDEKDWETLLEEALRHGVAPAVYQQIKPIFRELNITGRLMTLMRDSYYRSTARNIRIYRKLGQVLSLLKNKGIDVILLKGVHLAEIVYGDAGLRPMADIDLLARKDDLSGIHQVLIEDGYVTKKLSSTTKHLAPYHKKDGIFLEVHFHIVDPPFTACIEINELWERAEKDSMQGLDVLTLCPEDLFLYLCFHGCIQHGFDSGLLLCLDIAHVIKHYGDTLDWERLWMRARQWGMERCVYLALGLVEKTLGVSMPDIIVNKVNPGPDYIDALDSAEQLIAQKSKGVTRHFARLFGSNGWREKLKHVKQRAFPPKEVMFRNGRRPEGKKRLELWLLYFTRTRFLLKKHGKKIWLGLRKDPKTLKALDTENKKNALRNWLTHAGQLPDC